GKESVSSHIIENLIDLANRLNQVIVAEGVETREQAEYLASRGVHLLQGYLFGKPVPFDVFIKEHNLTDLYSSGRASERVLNPATPA
ncbi:EAL domain-containing protein, partial [Aeromonas caviae]